MSTVSPADPSSPQRGLTTICALLEGLVRNTRGGSPPEQLARRLFELWREDAESVLLFQPEGLRCDDRALHAVEGGWVYYAFMAGVRSIAITPMTEAPDVIRLAQELAQVRFNIEAAQRLRRWIWEEDGEAFRFTVTQSFAEAVEATDVPGQTQETTLRALRSAGLEALDGYRMRSEALDRAAASPVFEVELPQYRQASRSRAHEVDGDQLRTLLKGCADPVGWAEFELRELAAPEFRGTLPPARLARRVTQTLAGPDPQRAFEHLLAISRRDPQLAEAVTAQLTSSDAVSALTRSADPQRAARTLSEWLSAQGPFATRVFDGLVRAAPGDPQAAELAAAVYASDLLAGKRAMLLPINDLPGPACAWLLQKTPPDEVPAMLEQLDSETAGPALCGLSSGTLLTQHEQTIRRVLQTGSVAIRDQLGAHLATSTARHEERLLAASLVDSARADWGARAAFLVCNRMRDAGMSRDVLLPLARSRKTGPNLRIAALRVLENDPGALSEASRWRWSEWLDPPAVRTALQKARKRGDA